MPKRSSGFHYDATPAVHQFRGVPESCFDMVNMYGTYNIQPTCDTPNLFPLIGPGLPRQWREMRLDKQELDDLP